MLEQKYHNLSGSQRANLEARPSRGVPAHVWGVLDYTPNHWAVFHVHTSAARFNAYATSRQVGKSTAIKHDLFDAMYEAPRENDITHMRDIDGNIKRANPNVVGVVSDTYEHAELVVFPFISLLTELIGEDAFSLNKNQHVLRIIKTGAELRWFSAENPQAGQGNTFSRLYFDESQNVSDAFWLNVRPALGARMAQVFAFGTPDALEVSTWFEGMFLKGQDPEETDYYSYTIPCWLNRWLPLEDVKDALATMSEREFRMKYLGEWVKHEGSVFANPDACFTGAFTNERDEKGTYVIGLDLAKSEDYTVAYVFNTVTHTIVERWRVNHLPYTLIADRVAEMYAKYRCRRIRMDTTGVGEPVHEMLQAKGLHITPFVFGLKSKEKLVSTLASAIEHKKLILPKEDRQLLRELNAFKRKVTPSGNVTYSAPLGFHDDTVMALGLAVLEAGRTGSALVSSYLE